MNAREAVRSLVDARLQVLESPQGAAGILQARGQSALQRLQKQQAAAGNTALNNLQQKQAQTPHKTPPSHPPSNKPSWGTTAKSLLKGVGSKALHYNNPIGMGVTAGLDALVPGLGVVSRIIQKGFGDSVNEDTSQSGQIGARLFGYHHGFWTVNSGPNQPTVSIPNHRVYSKDGVTQIIGRPGMKGRIVKTKKGPAFHSTDDGGPVSNPVGGTPLTLGVDYTSRI